GLVEDVVVPGRGGAVAGPDQLAVDVPAQRLRVPLAHVGVQAVTRVAAARQRDAGVLLDWRIVVEDRRGGLAVPVPAAGHLRPADLALAAVHGTQPEGGPQAGGVVRLVGRLGAHLEPAVRPGRLA